MASISEPRLRNIYGPICRKIKNLREEYGESIIEKAERVKDVTLNSEDALTSAEQLIQEGYNQFVIDVHNLYNKPPWSDIAEMAIEASKDWYFFAFPGLLTDVQSTLQGEPRSIQEDSDEDVWDPL